MRLYVCFVICAFIIANVNGCGPQGSSPKVSLVNEITSKEKAPTAFATSETSNVEEGICSDRCFYSYCRGGNPDDGGVQLNTNKGCENYCVWMNGTTPNDTPVYPGECLKSASIGDAHIDCRPCKGYAKSQSIDSKENEKTELVSTLENERCCDVLKINAETQTEIDEVIPGQYHYQQDYNGYPVYKKEENSDAFSTLMPLPLYLFYHENRWVVEPTVGSVTHSTGRELWGLLRYNGTYTCPEKVGKQWMYYADSAGIVDRVDETIVVQCNA